MREGGTAPACVSKHVHLGLQVHHRPAFSLLSNQLPSWGREWEKRGEARPKLLSSWFFNWIETTASPRDTHSLLNCEP